MTHSFNLREVNAAVIATPFAGHLHHLRTTPSTNDLALKAAQCGERIGVWIADQQIAGRGRGAHTWHSPAGSGLYMTALIAPPIPMQNALALSLRVAIAVQSAISATFGFRIPSEIDIRWPNDLMLNGRKVGGILIDTASNPGHPPTLRYAIVGMGINLNHLTFPAELDSIATSILRERPTPHPSEPPEPLLREPLATAIILALDAQVQALSTGNLQPVTDNPSAYSTWIANKRVRVEARDGNASYTGTTAGLNPSGFLLVNGDDGQLHSVLSGGLREP